MFDNGGPAFPNSPSPAMTGAVYGGMTLRDYFAAKAIGHITDIYGPYLTGETGFRSERCAALAYELADAMLKARALTKENSDV